MLATDVPAPAARERRDRQRPVAVAAPAAAVDVGDRRERGGGHYSAAGAVVYTERAGNAHSEHSLRCVDVALC